MSFDSAPIVFLTRSHCPRTVLRFSPYSARIESYWPFPQAEKWLAITGLASDTPVLSSRLTARQLGVAGRGTPGRKEPAAANERESQTSMERRLRTRNVAQTMHKAHGLRLLLDVADGDRTGKSFESYRLRQSDVEWQSWHLGNPMPWYLTPGTRHLLPLWRRHETRRARERIQESVRELTGLHRAVKAAACAWWPALLLPPQRKSDGQGAGVDASND